MKRVTTGVPACWNGLRRPRAHGSDSGQPPSFPLRTIGLTYLLLLIPLCLGSPEAQQSPRNSSAPLGSPEEYQRRGDLALAARYLLHRYCRDCHSGPKRQGRVTITDPDQLLRQDLPVPWVKPGEPSASQILHFLEEGSMPPGNRPRPGPEEVRILREWIAAGAPKFPAALDEGYILTILTQDLSQRPRDAPYIRYVSFVHRIPQRPGSDELRKLENELRLHLHQCGVRSLVPVDPAATIFRFDIREVHWQSRELFVRLQQGVSSGLYPLSPYDLLLLDYPRADNGAASAGWPQAIQNYLREARLLRPIPYVHGDWLSRQLAPESPQAEVLRSLTELAQALERQNWPPVGQERDVPCGPVPRPFHTLTLPSASLPSNLLPVTAWYPPASLPSNVPKGWQAECITPQGQRLDTVRTGEPFQLRIRTPNDVHFTLLMIWCTGHIEVVETNRGGFLQAGEHILTPRDAEAFRIVDILTGEKQTREFFLLLTSSQPLPPVTIVRSRHAASPRCERQKRYPIERFLLEPQERSSPIGRLLVTIPLRDIDDTPR